MKKAIKEKSKSVAHTIGSVIAIFIFSVAAQSLLAAWVPPTGLPTAGNLSIPIYGTSTAVQVVGNSLIVNGLFSVANSWDAYFGGKVGIGNSSPSQALDVSGGINFTKPFNVNGNSGSSSQLLLSQGAGAPPVWTTVTRSVVPAGYAILGTTTSTPSGYTYTGSYFQYYKNNIWAAKASMPTARGGLVARAVNGIIYAIGGYNGSYLSTNEAYNPSTNTWTSKAAMPTARRAAAAAAVNGIIYVIGGYNGSYLSTNEAYDPSSNTWTSKTAMPTARDALGAAVVNNIVYAMGGTKGTCTSCAVSNNEAYDPSVNTWSSKKSMTASTTNFAVTVVNNIIYTLGGSSYEQYCLGSSQPIQEYFPTTNLWGSTGTYLQRADFNAEAIGNMIYAIGGASLLSPCGSADGNLSAYDTTGGLVSSAKSSMPTLRYMHASAVVNNRIYVIGGFNGSSYLATNEVYMPSWSTTLVNGYLFQKN